MFSSITHNLHTIANFEQAARVWSRGYDHSKRRGRVGSHWSPNERSLLDYHDAPQRMHHYRLVRRVSLTNRVFYEAVLHQTALCRWHEPDENGVELREFRSYPSVMSRQFLWHVARINERTFTQMDTEGEQRLVPIYDGNVYAKLYYTHTGRLLVDRSSHAPIGRKVVSADLRAARAKLRRELSPYLDAMMYCAPQFFASWQAPGSGGAYSYSSGRPFLPRSPAPGEDLVSDRLLAMCSGTAEPMWDLESLEVLRDVAQSVYHHALDVAAYRGRPRSRYWVAGKGYVHEKEATPVEPLPMLQFRKALDSALMRLSPLAKPDTVEPLPQFPLANECPSNFVFL